MVEDFAVLDFALVDAPPRDVAQALARAEAPDPANGKGKQAGLLGRLIGRRAAAPTPATPLLVQPRGTLPAGVLAREMVDDMGFGGADREIRLSAPIGPAKHTLIEFRERSDAGPSPRLAALSRALPKAEVLAFRLTGGRHPGGEYGFTVFRGGAVVRALRIHRASAEDDWQRSQTGSPHPLEEEAPPDPSDPGGLISPSRQAALLAALGIDADELLVDRSAHSAVLELSTHAGGTPPAALPASQPAAPAPVAPAPAPAASDEDRATWEDEITTLLVAAVTDGLTEDEQVPWLDAMTADLEAGRTEAALDRARALLARGTRPEAERDAAATRLAQLFGLES